MQVHELNLTLDWPDTKLWKNQSNGKHWAVESKAALKQKTDAFVSTREALGRNFPQIKDTVAVTYTAVKGHCDMDGLLTACKHMQDGIAQALQVDDKCFRPVTLDWENGPTKCVRVMLRWWDE